MVSKSSCEDKTHFGTVPNNLESIQLTQSANLSSMSDQGVFELVWENGQLLTRGFPKRSQKIPSCNIGHSFHSSNARLENGRPKFVTSDSIVYDSHHNTSSMPKDKQNEPVLLHELYKSHFNYDCFLEHTRGNNISYDHRLLKDSQSQVVPVHETAPTTGNSQAHQFSLQQQHHQVSKTLEPERKKERVNFSLFLRSTAVAVPTRGEKLQNKPEPVLLASATYGLKSVKDSMDINANMSVPDVQSEAVNGQSSSSPTGKCKEPAVPSSSLCSLGASNNPTYNTFKRRYEDTEGSACSSDHNEEKLERKAVPARGSKSNKKKRTPEVHNLSERRRRDKINKKMRALQELIPNCNKVDKASMLDEAIAYLKTLQFQVKVYYNLTYAFVLNVYNLTRVMQMMSMGSGVCMPPMMLRLPTGMQQMHTPQMSHFSPMGIGMGVGCNPAQFLIPPTAVPGIFPQPLPMSMLSAQLGLGVSRAVAAPFTKSNNSSKI